MLELRGVSKQDPAESGEAEEAGEPEGGTQPLCPVCLPACLSRSRYDCLCVSKLRVCCRTLSVWLSSDLGVFFVFSLFLTLCFALFQSCVFSLWLSLEGFSYISILQNPRQCRGSQEEKKPAPHPMEFRLFLALMDSVPIPCRTSLLTRRCRDSPTDILLCQAWQWTWLWDPLHKPSSLYVAPDHVH